MQAEPPQPQMPMVSLGEVPMLPVPQGFSIEKGDLGGKPVALLRFTLPMAGFIIMLDRDGAETLISQVREIFSGIHVVSAVPG